LRLRPRGRVAPRARHQTCGADLGPVELGQSVDRFGLTRQRGMVIAIPALVFRRIAQPEIGGQIDDLQGLGQIADHLLRGRMRQRAKAQIYAREINLLDLLQYRQVQMAQMRKHIGHALPGLGIGPHRRDAHIGMRGNQAHQLGPRIARSPQNRDIMRHVVCP